MQFEAPFAAFPGVWGVAEHDATEAHALVEAMGVLEVDVAGEDEFAGAALVGVPWAVAVGALSVTGRGLSVLEEVGDCASDEEKRAQGGQPEGQQRGGQRCARGKQRGRVARVMA